jgi:hypothetical protein
LWFSAVAPSSAQEYVGGRDFLTVYEIDLIREAQEPNRRIEQYLVFASLRMELIRQQLSVEKPGRSAEIHRNLGQYGKIIDAVDMVVDDALVREIDIQKGLELLTTKEKEFLAALEKIRSDKPNDLERFEFVLEDAIEITADSIELASGDLGERKREVVESDARERKEIEGSLSDVERRAAEKVKAKEAEAERKRPSLLKPGEKKEPPR